MEIIKHGSEYVKIREPKLYECPHCHCQFLMSLKEYKETVKTREKFWYHYSEQYFNYIHCPECKKMLMTKKLKDFHNCDDYDIEIPQEIIKL